jgi:hypothetical protein
MDYSGLPREEGKFDYSGLPRAEKPFNAVELVSKGDPELADALRQDEGWWETVKKTVTDWGKAAKYGWQESVTGMAARGKMPDSPEFAPTGINQFIAGQVAGAVDTPWYLAGLLFGGAASGNPVGAAGGAFALPAGLRKVLVDRYTKGEISSVEEFKSRLAGAATETIKGEIAGATGALTGQLAPLAAKIPAEALAITATQAFLENHVPTLDEFQQNAWGIVAQAIGFKAVGRAKYEVNKVGTKLATSEVSKAQERVNSKLLAVYERTGRTPGEIMEMAQKDPTIMEDLLSRNIKVPRALQHERPEFSKKIQKPGDKEPAAPVKEVVTKTKDTLINELVDDLHPVKKWVIKSIGGKEAAAKLDAIDDPYKMMRLYRGVGGKFEHMLEYGLWDVATMQKNSKGFKEILKMVDDTEGFQDYLVARRAVYLHKKGHKTGLEAFDEEMRFTRDKFEKIPQFQKAAAEFDLLVDSSLKMLKDSGILSAKQFADIKVKSKYYVPFARLGKDKGRVNAASGNAKDPIKGLTKTGSDRPIKDPLEQTLQNLAVRLVMAERNMTNAALVRFARQYDPEGIKMVERGERQEPLNQADQAELQKAMEYVKREIPEADSGMNWVVRFTDSKGVKQKGFVVGTDAETAGMLDIQYVTREGTLGMQTIPRKKLTFLGPKKHPEIQAPIPELADPVAKRAQELGINPDDITATDFVETQKGRMVVYENGERTVYEVHSELADIINNLGYEQASLVMKALQAPAGWLRAGATLSPDFALRNVNRDVISQMVYSTEGGVFNVPFKDFFTGLMESKRKGDAYQAWLRSGGAQAMMVSVDKPHMQKQIYQELQGLPWYNKANPMKALRLLSEYSEKGTRIGEFKKVMKKSVDPNDRRNLTNAAFASRDITLDFAKSGHQGRKFNRLTAFFNAAVQGHAKMLEMLTHADPRIRRNTWIKAMTYVTLPSMGLAAMTHNHPAIKEIEQWQKDIFWLIPLGSDEHATVLRIPKPFEMGFWFGSLPERFVHWAMDEFDPKAFSGLADSLGAHMPSIAPTVALPWVENLTDWSFWREAPLIGRSMEGRLPEYQYSVGTTELAKSISKVIGKVTPNSLTKGYSPIEIENVINGYTGGLGKYALQLVDAAARKGGVIADPIRPEKTLADMPFIKAFVARSPSASAHSVTTFMERYERYRKITASINGLTKEFKFDDVANLIPQSDFGALEGVNQSLSDIRNLIKSIYHIQKFDNMEREELSLWKRQRIEKLYFDMMEISKHGNTILDKLEEFHEIYKDKLK